MNNPSFIISYDRVAQSLKAHFSFPMNREPYQWELPVMKQIEQQFIKASKNLLYSQITSGLFENIIAIARDILNQVEHQTNIKFELETHNFISRGLNWPSR